MPRQRTFFSRLQAATARGTLAAALALPYESRVRTAGVVVSWLIAPALGWRRRIRENLALAWPELPQNEVERIVRRVPDNVGRMLAEVWSGAEFVARVAETPFAGPGLEAFEEARAQGRPVMLITAHYGNYDAMRATLHQRGHSVGGLYKPMTNEDFNTTYVRVLETIGQPVFPTTSRGIAGFLRNFRAGGIAGMVVDVGSRKAPVLRFFGIPAHTALSAAEWAIEADAPLIPVFSHRNPDGLSFRMDFEAPIPRGSAAEMMQATNDVIEARVRAHPEQWFWIHRRWKTHGKRKVALRRDDPQDAPPD